MAILVHGGRDHCRNWDWVALALRRHFHLIAPDLRGHGDSDWAIGGSYAMIDHVLDLYQLMTAIAGGPVTLIGHSLGAGVALQAAGVFPGWITGWATCARSLSASRASTRTLKRRWNGCASRIRISVPSRRAI